MRNPTIRLLSPLVAFLLVLAACGSSDSDTTPEAEPAEQSSESDTTDQSAEEDTDEPAEDDADEPAEDEAEVTTDTEETTSTGAANTAEVVAAADAFIASLSDDELGSLLYDFGDGTITSGWSNLPACPSADRAVIRAGLYHEDLTDEQVTLALALAESILSDEGFDEYQTVILGDDYLQDTFGNTVWDSGCYAVAIYGTPSETDAFAVQFGGHHIARMVTYEGDTVTVTPAFLGIEPSSFEVDGTTYDPLGDEMAAVFGIFDGLSDDQLTTADLGEEYGDVIMGPGTDSPFPDTRGVLVADLSDEQQAAVLATIELWVGDFDDSVSETLMAQYESELSETYVAWSTATSVEIENSYARIDGPSVWVEVATQSGASGIHYHSIYRDKNADYGDAG